MKNISYDESSGKLIRTEEINIGTTDAEDAKQSLKIELAGIIRQVKGLKKRAEEIKAMLTVLDKQVKTTTVEPVTEESQSASAETPQST